LNPSATCYIYDNDSTDFVLSWLDMNLLTDGGAYEIDFSGYTLRVTAAVQDDPESVLGKYNGEAFEFIEEMSCHINLESAPNCITVNTYLRKFLTGKQCKVDPLCNLASKADLYRFACLRLLGYSPIP